MPLSIRPSTARSASSIEVMLWHQSTSVVTPASICAQRADQVAEIVVLGLVARRQIEMHVPEVVGGHPFRADAAQRRLPGVHMRVHQARHHDLVGGVDHLVGRRIEISPDGFDPIAAKQKLPALEVADPGIERDQPAAFDQDALHRVPSAVS